MNAECTSCECPKKINQLTVVAVSFAVICILALIRNDEIGITAGGTIKLPFIGADVDSGNFLFVGPAILLFIMSYLHIYVQHWFDCPHALDKKTCVAKIDSAVGSFFYYFIYFGLFPAVLLVFYLISRGKPNYMNYTGFLFASAAGVMPFLFFSYRKMWRMLVGSAFLFFLLLGAACFLSSINFDPADYFPLRLRGARLESHNMLPYNLKGMQAETATFKNCVFFQKQMANAHAPRATFDGSNLYGANLDQADLGSASFVGADLSWGSLMAATLTNADFQGAKLVDAFLGFSTLEAAKIEEADLSGASLQFANLKGASLRWSTLVKAYFSFADMRDVDFAGADLKETQFYKTILAGAKLSFTRNLVAHQLQHACGDEKTELPVEFNGIQLARCKVEEPRQAGYEP